MQKVKSIHFVGIKGVGLTPLAIIAKEAGINVTGSDVADEFITDKALHEVGIEPLVGFDPNHLPQELDLVITTGAHEGYDNPEVVEARERLIPVMTKGEAVGAFMEGSLLGRSFKGIAIAGSHGKTTTSAMLTTIFKEVGQDPSYIVGTGSIGGVTLPGHLGKGEYFIAESDEYATEPKHNHKAQFLWQYPHIALFTNIEHDHPDIYRTLGDVVKVFEEFARNVPVGGLVIGNGDDGEVRKILAGLSTKTISYGFSELNDYVLTNVEVSDDHTRFRVSSRGVDLGEFELSVFGEHNALNALGALIVALESGISVEQGRQALVKFTGSKRRLEYKGQLKGGAYVFDDYAHHPTEIKSTLRSLRLRYPDANIIAIFQPHTYSRTKALLHEFTAAFRDANQVILTDIFASARESKDPSITSELFAHELSKHHSLVLYVPTLTEIPLLLANENLTENTVIVVMGAGDIYKIITEFPMI